VTDVTAEFFGRLAERGTVPGFARTTGSVRFELTRGDETEHWRVAFKRGAVTVDRGADATDCVVRTDASTFEELASGRANVMATLLRGRLEADGEPELLTRFQRLFPAPVKRKMTTSSARTVGKRRG